MKKVIFTLSAAAVLASCGGNQTPSTTESQAPATEQTTTEAAPQAVEFTVNAIGNTMPEMAYDTKELKVKSGSQVTINLTNQGSDASMVHNLVIVKEGSEKDVAMEGLNLKDQNFFNASNPNVIGGSAIADPGKTVTFTFTAPAAGTYTYICTYPGHWQQMQGKLIVE